MSDLKSDSAPGFSDLNTISIEKVYNIKKEKTKIKFTALISLLYNRKAPVFSDTDNKDNIKETTLNVKVSEKTSLCPNVFIVDKIETKKIEEAPIEGKN